MSKEEELNARLEAVGDEIKNMAKRSSTYRVSFTVEYELFIQVPSGSSAVELRAAAEDAYAEGTDWVLVGHDIGDITEVDD